MVPLPSAPRCRNHAQPLPQPRRSARPLHPELGPGLRRDDDLEGSKVPLPSAPRCRNHAQPLPPNHVALQRRFTLSWVPAFAGMTVWKGPGTAAISFFVVRANYFLVLPSSPFPLPIVIPFVPLSPSDRHPFRPSSPLDRHPRSTVIPAQAGTQLAALPQSNATATPQTRRSATPLHPELGPGLRRDDDLEVSKVPLPSAPRCRNQTQPLPPNHVALQRRFTLSWVPAFAGMTVERG